MFCCALLFVHSSIAIILMGKRELVALLNLSSWCLVVVGRLFLEVPRGCLQFVIVVFPDHTHLLFMNVTLKYALFLKIRNVALYQERTILIISKFQYMQCIGSRPVKPKPVSRGISSKWYTISFPIILLSEISQTDYVHVNTCNNVQIMHPYANNDGTRYLSEIKYGNFKIDYITCK